LAAAAATFGLFFVGASALASAQSGPNAYPYQNAYSIRQGPDGTYDSLADFVGDIRGRPCGVQCEREAWERWARYYREHGIRVRAPVPVRAGY
jgi:hypothetical protein